jgi:glycosyltransferase involved in cell wall biosynthesis
MCRPEEIAVVIPCLNEARSIGSLIHEVRMIAPNVIVINDGSLDCTASEATQAGAIVLNHSSSRGKGASLRAGFELASRLGFQWALAMDGDGQHAPTDIPRFLSHCGTTNAAMFIGNRMDTCDRMPLVRRLVNRWMTASINSFCNTSIPDSQCGFRLINLAAWNLLTIRTDHFEIESEMIVRFAKAGFSIDFLPVETRYASETSKIRPLHDTCRWFRWWFGIRHELSPASFRNTHPRFDPRPQDAPA